MRQQPKPPSGKKERLRRVSVQAERGREAMMTNGNNAGSAGQTTALWGGWTLRHYEETEDSNGPWDSLHAPDSAHFDVMFPEEAALLRALTAERDAANAKAQALADALQEIARRYPLDWGGTRYDPTPKEYTEDDLKHQRSLLMGWEIAGNIARTALAAADGEGVQG